LKSSNSWSNMSKLKRTPLFGYDGNLGIPIIPQIKQMNLQDRTGLNMEVGLAPPKSGYAPVPPPKGYAPQLPAKTGYAPAPAPRPVAPSTPNKTVNFTINPDNEKKREKFLTAKYGAHQMALIRKRLKVEMWMYDQLQTLYAEEEASHDIEIDLDEVLDMEDDHVRKKFLKELLVGSTSSKELINKFVEDLLEKAKTL